MRRLRDWLDPPAPPPVSGAPRGVERRRSDRALDMERNRAIDEQTARQGFAQLHGRRADRTLRESEQVNRDMERRLAALTAAANAEGRQRWDG